MMYYSSYDSPYNAYTLNPMDPTPRVDPYAEDTTPDNALPDPNATQPTQLNSQDYATQFSSDDLWGCLMPLSSQPDALRIDLDKTSPCVTIGRSRKNTYQLNDSTYVSSHHLSLEWRGGNDVRLTNFSTNGIMVDETPMLAGGHRYLANGSRILFGHYKEPYIFIFRLLTQDKLGDVLEEYDIMQLLGSGSYGHVYKALSRRTGRCHAIKRLHDLSTQQARKMAATEIEILTTLDHPYIIKLEEAFYGSSIHIVLEYAGNGDLLNYICANCAVIDEPMAQHMAYQLCSALEYMHKRGIVHRDLKPENILVTTARPEIFKVADFGLSTVKNLDRQLKTFCGSPCFMAPELHALQISGQAATPDIGYDKQVDSWAFGQIIYEFFAGRHMIDIFRNTPDAECKRLKERYTPKVLALFNLYYSKLSDGARDFLQQLLQPDPKRRLSIVNAMNHCWMKKYEPPVFEWNVNGGENIKARSLLPILPHNSDVPNKFDRGALTFQQDLYRLAVNADNLSNAPPSPTTNPVAASASASCP